ncbi:MAG TPA: hypothetical protein VH331_06525 [Allosphingosinicella sp.]|jgi:hypothetical protein|nr:hypothetical protein [Allosphingosinicella sp.]
MRVFALWLLALLALPAAATAQQKTLQDPLLDRMVGHWVLEGTIAHKAVVHDVTAAWVIQHQYLKIDEVSRTRNAEGRPDYQATVYIGWYEPEHHYACVWLDVYGGMAPESLGTAPPSGDSIRFVFRNHDGTILRTVMRWNAADRRWSWTIDQGPEDKLSNFARVILRRP